MLRLDPGSQPSVADALRRVPFTLAFLGAMLLANALSGTVSGQIAPAVLDARGIGVDAIRDGDLTRFVTAIFLSHDLPMLLRQLVFAAGVIGAAEWRWGSWRAAGLFFGLDFVVGAILLAAIALIPHLAPLAGVTDVGMSLGGFGLIGVFVASWRHAGGWLAAIVGLVAAKYAIAPDPVADGGHLIALFAGFGAGVFEPRRPGRADRAPAVRQGLGVSSDQRRKDGS
ncbi:hypothetical protein [Sagittula stellata]|uniref:hypothetical protein n=1 Tax=Sagittula stellata TaxID=52603 RepID=UPI0018DDDC4E|nr:hypothetical protein [Sagittula stellata]